jgi:hypothetical protein
MLLLSEGCVMLLVAAAAAAACSEKLAHSLHAVVV